MRLIDADALYDDIMERYCKDCEKRKGMKRGKWRVIYEIGEAPCRACDVDDLKMELDEAPTIDTEPVSHGRWIECESENGIHIHKCSECGKRDMYKGAFKDFNGRGFSFYYKRQCCPYCGAKMDLDEVKE